ncbi:MAG: ribosome small subunit-dependent GTPase A [Gammaproteobacteria bacterium]|nr:ribosome small subunit-dependent GTPase A [Gammaproteobacteria bacterium]
MKNKFNKQDKHKKYVKPILKRNGTEREGTIVAHFGAVVEVEDKEGTVFRCHLRKNHDPVITGDEVLWHLEKDNTGIVLGHLPRKSLLVREEDRHRNKLIAANIDKIIIVLAPGPQFSEHLLDCYLVAAESRKIQPIILLNKMDLLNEADLAEMKMRFSLYVKMGYKVIYSSIFMSDGLAELSNTLENNVSVLVGPSGVGKSSIIAKLTGLNDIKIGEVSTHNQGKHTTTMTRLYYLPLGGALIDSPGVREFALWNMPPEEIFKGFIEFQPFLSLCKFRNCQHKTEPECAVQLAIEQNKISRKRWESYLEMIEIKR